jgi:hypothetical protein
MREKVEVVTSLLQFSTAVGVSLFHRNPRGDIRVAALNWDTPEIRPDELNPEFTVKLRFDEAQQLMDELWRAGVRPAATEASVGALAAVKYHLEDMRRIAFSRNDVSVDVESPESFVRRTMKGQP